MEVDAESLFEAAVKGLALLKKDAWTDGIGPATGLKSKSENRLFGTLSPSTRLSGGFKDRPRVRASGAEGKVEESSVRQVIFSSRLLEGLMKLLVAIVGMIGIILSVNAGAQGKTDPNLTKISEAFVKAFNAKDTSAVALLYTEDAVLMPPNVPAVNGRKAIQTFYEGLFKQGLSDLKLSVTEATVTGQYGFDTGTSSIQVKAGGSSLTLTGVGGSGAAVHSPGKFVTIYKRVQGEWKIAYDIFNDDKPATP